MEYTKFNNEASRIIIYREDNKQTEIISKGDQNKLLIVVDTTSVLMVYEVCTIGREPVLHSGYADWLSFEIGR